MSTGRRFQLLDSLTPSDLYDEIGSLEIGSRVAEMMRVITKESSGLVDFQESDSVPLVSEETWNHLHALTWYSTRNRPESYLEIGSGLGPSMRMVAMSSPETHLVSCRSDWREISQTRLATFMRGLSCSGSNQPLMLVGGDNLARQAQYFGDWSLRAQGRGQPHIKEFDLIFVDGSQERAGVYRDLKNALLRCALGGMVVFRGTDRGDPALPGQYCPRLSGYWERLPLRFPGFRFVKAPPGREVGIACRAA